MKRPVPHRLDVGNRAGAADTAFLLMLTQMLTLKTVKLPRSQIEPQPKI